MRHLDREGTGYVDYRAFLQGSFGVPIAALEQSMAGGDARFAQGDMSGSSKLPWIQPLKLSTSRQRTQVGSCSTIDTLRQALRTALANHPLFAFLSYFQHLSTIRRTARMDSSRSMTSSRSGASSQPGSARYTARHDPLPTAGCMQKWWFKSHGDYVKDTGSKSNAAVKATLGRIT
jgi:hypothetical protein